MILIPGLVGNACLVMKSHLSDNQLRSCQTILSRAYERIDGDPNGSMGAMTGCRTSTLFYLNFIAVVIITQVLICWMLRQEELT